MPPTAAVPLFTTHGLLRAGRRVGSVLLVVLLLVAGAWTSWDTARHVMLTSGQERGTMTVTRCDGDTCTGSYAPSTEGAKPRDRVVIERSIGEHKGATVPVAIKAGSDDVVRIGGAGFLYAWVPLGGALMLAGVVIGGGLRLTRAAWATGLAGAALLVAAFVAL
ncbi:hypothetical protein [Streptomyces apocyni]|uniref:hypothetical protein n=1 Tax=Streptomyces apocyni TaxID=2654677 RepID=UPI0012EAEB39|nr:hypothetical protein [Streptomyces apocyni]